MELRKTKGKFVKHVACSHCPSSDAMAVYEQEDGTCDATCFSCGHYEEDVDTHGSQSNSGRGVIQQMLTVNSILVCPQLELHDRKIRQGAVDHYGVKTILDGSNGRDAVAHCFPYVDPASNQVVAFKKRDLGSKKFLSIGNGTDLPFFGQDVADTSQRKLYITEGEYDALALFQVLKDQAGPGYGHINPAVVSLPNGSKSVAKTLANNSSFTDLFNEIVLAFDQDEAGQKAVEEACSILDPLKVRVAKFSEKDACDMLLKGKERELKWAVVTEAKPFVPSGIATVNDLYEQATSDPEIGRPWAWPTLSKLTFGRKPGVFLVGAGVGVGKTEFFHEQAGHIIREERKPVGLFLFEEAPARSLRVLAGKMIGKAAHIPDRPLPEDEYLSAIDKLRDPVNLVYTFDHKWDRDWKSVFAQIKHIVVANGVRDIFIDPLTVLISHEENTDRSLHAIMDDISILTQDPYNCCVYVSSHLNEPPRDQRPHEEGGRVKESQFAGSRAMIRYANYVIGLERNKQAEDPIERNTTTVRILKDREYGSATGETFSVYYDQNTAMMQETQLEF